MNEKNERKMKENERKMKKMRVPAVTKSLLLLHEQSN